MIELKACGGINPNGAMHHDGIMLDTWRKAGSVFLFHVLHRNGTAKEHSGWAVALRTRFV